MTSIRGLYGKEKDGWINLGKKKIPENDPYHYHFDSRFFLIKKVWFVDFSIIILL